MKRLALALIATLALAPAAPAQNYMTGDEVAKAVSGNTGLISHATPAGTRTETTVLFRPDGTLRMRQVTKALSQNIVRDGVWQVFSGQFCYRTARDIMWICNKFQRLADDRLRMSDGITDLNAEVRIQKGNTAKL